MRGLAMAVLILAWSIPRGSDLRNRDMAKDRNDLMVLLTCFTIGIICMGL